MTQNMCGCNDPVINVPIKGMIMQLDAGAFPSGGMPNLQIGVETKRAMLYMGKQVYSQLVDFGALPNSAKKSVAHGIVDADWIMVDHNYSRVDQNTSFACVQNMSTNSVGGGWSVHLDKSSVWITTGANRAAFSAIICINYTKVSDPVIG